MKIKGLLSSILILCALTVQAQNYEEIYRLSLSNSAFSTARSSAMGGAFTSLGADAASVDINPAGIGMFRSNVLSISPSLNITSVTSDSHDLSGGVLSKKENNSSFSVNNFTAIFNVYNRKNSSLKSINLAISYNRQNTFSQRSIASAASSKGSISDLFARQLKGVNPEDITSNKDNPLAVYHTSPVSQWGAMMNYNNLMIDGTTAAPWDYSINPSGLTATDLVNPDRTFVNRGNTNTVALSMGMNIKDVLYLGMNVGAKTYSYEESSIYTETGVTGNVGDFEQMNYQRSLYTDGTAFDFKVGATYQPVTGLRIGLAYHIPTVTHMNEEYVEYQTVLYNNNNDNSGAYYAESPYSLNNYKIKSSSRLLAGISYRLGSFGILAFDYTYNMNNVGIKYDGLGGYEKLDDYIKDSHNFNAGLEIQVSKGLFVRAGYAYYGNAYKDFDTKDDEKYGVTQNISAGLGYSAGRYYFDLAYINVRNEVAPYSYYGGSFDDVTILSESYVTEKIAKNIITLTFGIRY